MHTILFQGAKPAYNPGLITNSFVLLPYGTWTLLTAVGFFTSLDWMLSMVVGALVVAYFAIKTRGRLAQMQKTVEQAAN